MPSPADAGLFSRVVACCYDTYMSASGGSIEQERDHLATYGRTPDLATYGRTPDSGLRWHLP